jgi:F-type H+-transporting ATPase subunit b
VTLVAAGLALSPALANVALASPPTHEAPAHGDDHGPGGSHAPQQLGDGGHEAGGHGAGDHAGGHGHHNTFSDVLWVGGFQTDGKTPVIWLVLNFVVLMFLLERVLFGNLRRRHAEKRAGIKGEVERASAARSEAEALMAEYKAKLAKLDGEIDAVLAEARKRADADRVRILVEAEREAEKIREAARAAADREASARRRTLEREVVEQALAKAEAAIRAQFGAADQRRMVDDYVQEVGAARLDKAL